MILSRAPLIDTAPKGSPVLCPGIVWSSGLLTLSRILFGQGQCSGLSSAGVRNPRDVWDWLSFKSRRRA